MPEGHTIHRAARRLSSVLKDRLLDRVAARAAQLIESNAAEHLRGATVTLVEARGKHLLIHTDNGWTVHSHLRMDGVWHLYRAGERWRKSRERAWLQLGVGDWDAVNFDGPILRLIRTDELHRERVLTELGPDILVEPFDDSIYLHRMTQHVTREIGDAVLQQRIVAGIGNIYKNESLFLSSIDPWRRVGTLSDTELLRIRATATRIMQAGVLDARANTFAGPGPPGQWVYGRTGRSCRRCDTKLAVAKQGEEQRTTWWCPQCQT